MFVSAGVFSVDATPVLVEPYPPLHGDDPHGLPPVPLSPDPLVSTVWSAATNLTGLQIYEMSVPEAWIATPATAFQGLGSLKTGKAQITVLSAGSLRLDFGQEHAAWFEFTSPDMPVNQVTASISEYNQPWPGKTRALKAFRGGKYRLETNSQLYEGVRFAWINFDPTSFDPTCVAVGTEGDVISLSCPAGASGAANRIKAVTFAEFGTAEGDCATGFKRGSCAFDLRPNLTHACVGRQSCTVRCIQGSCAVDGAPIPTGGDPCPGTPKKVTAQVQCERTPAPSPSPPWNISDLKIVCQSKPTNYTGAFSSSDDQLTRVWYSGAYGSRLNMMPCSVRGIRTRWVMGWCFPPIASI